MTYNGQDKTKLSDVLLDGNKLPWKESAKHIGNYLHENGTMDKDVQVKRAQFIQTCMEQNDEFECLDMESKVKLLNIYNAHFTGSALWNFNSENFKQLLKSWNVDL